MNHRKQQGFTLIELMIAVALIAIMATLAIVSYTDYSQRARISSGLRLTSGIKQAIAEYHSRHGSFPESNAQAYLAAPTEFTDTRVRSISIDTVPSAGTIIITYKGAGSVAEGDTLLLIPEDNAGSIGWNCTSYTIINRLLPAQCR